MRRNRRFRAAVVVVAAKEVGGAEAIAAVVDTVVDMIAIRQQRVLSLKF
jgi:hypothetical protein